MSNNKSDRMLVSKEFKTFFKIKATKEGMTVIDYSRLIANNPNKLLLDEKTIEQKDKRIRGGKFESFF